MTDFMSWVDFSSGDVSEEAKQQFVMACVVMMINRDTNYRFFAHPPKLDTYAPIGKPEGRYTIDDTPHYNRDFAAGSVIAKGNSIEVKLRDE